MSVNRTVAEINEKIRKKQAVVVTAEEMSDIVDNEGIREAAKKVDVVTTGTFGPMCSSGAMINVGHTTPKMKIQHAWVNNVPAYSGIAAVDLYLGATELPEDDPMNRVFPGKFSYGGGHVIEALVRGEEVTFRAEAYGTDCYPRRKWQQRFRLKDLKYARLLNPRNAYQNYNVAVNAKKKRSIYTYMGVLKPGMGNANYCSAGQLSPLLNDPLYRTIGIGTRIFLGGGVGHIYDAGTQHAPDAERNERGVPTEGSGTLAVTGDLKQMSADFIRGVSLTGYGVSLAVGIGVPIPIIDEEMAYFTAVRDRDILASVVDYSEEYFANTGKILGKVSYEELRTGTIEINGRKIQTASLSSYVKAREIAKRLRQWIEAGEFSLSQPVELLPGPSTNKEKL